ncbi:MAG: STAS domain-containing protein [Rhodospirillaceae bacterium]
MKYEIRKASSVTTISLKGRMCFSDHAEFRNVIAAFDQPPGGSVVFDMSALEFIDSSGLGMLIIARDEAKRRQQELVIEKVKPDVKRLMDMAKFDRHFTIRP